MLILFEGLDKLGKSTQAKMLEYYLNSKDQKTKLFKQPDNKGFNLRKIINAPGTKMTPMALWALHLSSHAEQWATEITPALAEGYNVVMDRSWFSAIAYSHYGHGVDRETIIQAEGEANNHIGFTHMFIFWSEKLDPYGIGYDNTPMEQEDGDFKKRVNDGYKEIYEYYKDQTIEGNFYPGKATLIIAEEWEGRIQELHNYIVGRLRRAYVEDVDINEELKIDPNFYG